MEEKRGCCRIFFSAKLYVRILLVIFAGLLLFISFPRMNIWPAPFFAFLTLYFAIHGVRFKFAWLLGIIFGLAVYAPLIYWMIYVGYITWIPLLFYMSLYVCIFVMLAWFLINRLPAASIFALPALWTLIEIARSSTRLAFSWGLVGYSQSSNLILLQFLRIGGVFSISFLVVFFATTAWYLIAFRVRIRLRIVPIIISAVIFISVLVYGSASYFKLREGGLDDYKIGSLKVEMMQPNIPQELKLNLDVEYISKVIEDLLRENKSDDVDLIVLPESAVPYIINYDERGTEWLKGLILERNKPFLVGSSTVKGDSYYNSILLMSREGDLIDQYDKINLVPFGEFVPLRKLLFWVPQLKYIPADLSAGNRQTIFRIDDVTFGSVICFESSLPGTMRVMRSRGAQLLFVLTNDGWFKRSPALDQHFYMAAFRAIENGVTVVQSANTGISGAFLPDGSKLFSSSIEERTELIEEIPMYSISTIYSRFGDWGVIIFSLLSLISVIPYKIFCKYS
ncbi:MAG: apolipoprotein N-acyltransferase [Actinobacteria bacterium]|nr:apolipoprotein N-acyltransferase [Actinomycetota bacterium]